MYVSKDIVDQRTTSWMLSSSFERVDKMGWEDSSMVKLLAV